MNTKAKITLISLIFLIATPAYADILVSQTEYDDANTIYGSGEKFAQSFQVSADSDITSIILGLIRTGTPNGNTWVKIQSNNAGEPGTVLGTSANFANSGLTTAWPDSQEVEFTFSTAITLTANTTYWIVEETDNTTGGAGVGQLHESTNPYAGGFFAWYISSWTDYSGKDAYFKIIGTATGGGQEEQPTASSTATSTASTGDIAFGIAILITLSSFGLTGFAFNTLNAKKPWK